MSQRGRRWRWRKEWSCEKAPGCWRKKWIPFFGAAGRRRMEWEREPGRKINVEDVKREDAVC